MKHLFLILTAGCLLAAGCSHEKYGTYEIEAVNTVAGVAAGMSHNGELLILERGDQRQAVYISQSRIGEVKLMNCPDAPILFVKVNFFGKKGVSVLKVSLPEKNRDLKYYRYQEVGSNAKYQGKKAWIIDVQNVAPDGKTLRVQFDVQGEQTRRTGTFDPVTGVITLP